MAKATLTYSVDYIVESGRRYRRQDRAGRTRRAVVACLAVVAAFCFAMAFPQEPDHCLIRPMPGGSFSVASSDRPNDSRVRTVGIIFVTILSVVAGMTVVARYARFRMQLRAIKRLPYFGKSLEVDFGDDGIRFLSSLEDSFVRWDAFTHAVHYRDGALLCQGAFSSVWVPNTALSEGDDSAAFVTLLRAKIPKHRTIGPVSLRT